MEKQPPRPEIDRHLDELNYQLRQVLAMMEGQMAILKDLANRVKSLETNDGNS